MSEENIKDGVKRIGLAGRETAVENMGNKKEKEAEMKEVDVSE